jgi:PAS domain S-box-containing protein
MGVFSVLVRIASFRIPSEGGFAMKDDCLRNARAPAAGTSDRGQEHDSASVLETPAVSPGGGAHESAHLQFLYEVASRLLITREVDGFVDEACQRLGALIGLDAYFYFRVAEDTAELRLVSYGGIEPGLAAEIQMVPSAHVLCGGMVESRRPLFLDSVQPSENPDARFLQQMRVAVYACFPLVTDSGVYGRVAFARRDAQRFAEDEVSLMRSLAEHMASAIERTEAERLLRANEESFRAITEALPQLVWISDIEGELVFVNSQWTAYTGISQPHLLGTNWRECMEPEDRTRTCDYWMKALRAEVPYDLDYRLRRADGEYRWFKARATPLRDTEGRITKWFGSCTDVHDSKVLELKLRENEDWLRLLVGTVKDFALFSTDPGGIVTEWNPGAENTFGYSEVEMLGKNAALLFTPEDRAAGVPAQEQETAAREGSAADERWHMRKNGERFYASGVARPIRDQSGHLHGFLKVARDITEWKRHEEHLEATVADRTSQLRDMVGELESFSYSIVHDMRAPLRAMQSFARILDEECSSQLSPDGKDYIRRIVTAAERLDRLIQDVLSYSRASRADLRLTPVDVGRLVRNILESYPNLQSPNVEVRLEGDLPVVLGNEAALTQCISNLLTNAAKFVAPGVQPRIRVWAESDGNRARVFFQDNGIGIENAAQEKIFAIFQRASRGYEGTGIGLAIVKKAIERMNGVVGVQSQPGRGSTFWLELDRAT